MNKTKILTGRKVALWLGGFFLIVFAVNGLMTYLALTSWGGLETEDAYRKGLAYNQEIEAAKAQKKSGWKIALDTVPARLQGPISVKITRPKDSTPPVLISVTISRPATDKFDQTISLFAQSDGQYSAPYSVPLPGQWDLVILVKTQEDIIYTLYKRFYIKDDDTGASSPAGK